MSGVKYVRAFHLYRKIGSTLYNRVVFDTIDGCDNVYLIENARIYSSLEETVDPPGQTSLFKGMTYDEAVILQAMIA